MVAHFVSTGEDAAEIKRICEVAVAAFLTPSKESAHAVFETRRGGRGGGSAGVPCLMPRRCNP